MTARASGAVLALGSLAGACFGAAAFVVGPFSPVGRVLLAIVVLAPGLALQEFWRTQQRAYDLMDS